MTSTAESATGSLTQLGGKGHNHKRGRKCPICKRGGDMGDEAAVDLGDMGETGGETTTMGTTTMGTNTTSTANTTSGGRRRTRKHRRNSKRSHSRRHTRKHRRNSRRRH